MISLRARDFAQHLRFLQIVHTWMLFLLKIVKRIILLYDFVSDILKHKENRVKLQFAFCTVSFIHGS